MYANCFPSVLKRDDRGVGDRWRSVRAPRQYANNDEYKQQPGAAHLLIPADGKGVQQATRGIRDACCCVKRHSSREFDRFGTDSTVVRNADHQGGKQYRRPTRKPGEKHAMHKFEVPRPIHQDGSAHSCAPRTGPSIRHHPHRRFYRIAGSEHRQLVSSIQGGQPNCTHQIQAHGSEEQCNCDPDSHAHSQSVPSGPLSKAGRSASTSPPRGPRGTQCTESFDCDGIPSIGCDVVQPGPLQTPPPAAEASGCGQW